MSAALEERSTHPLANAVVAEELGMYVCMYVTCVTIIDTIIHHILNNYTNNAYIN
jgi:cation transport ATPase